MKSHTNTMWNDIVSQATPAFAEYFAHEESFIRENVTTQTHFVDLGCAQGRTTATILPYVNRVTCIDNDPAAIQDITRNLGSHPKVTIREEDMEHMSFTDKEDIVPFIGLTFVNFGDSRQSILKEIARATRSENPLLFSVYSENALRERVALYDKVLTSYNLDKQTGTVRFDNVISEQFSVSQIEAILANSPWRIDQVQSGEIYHLFKCRQA